MCTMKCLGWDGKGDTKLKTEQRLVGISTEKVLGFFLQNEGSLRLGVWNEVNADLAKWHKFSAPC